MKLASLFVRVVIGFWLIFRAAFGASPWALAIVLGLMLVGLEAVVFLILLDRERRGLL